MKSCRKCIYYKDNYCEYWEDVASGITLCEECTAFTPITN